MVRLETTRSYAGRDLGDRGVIELLERGALVGCTSLSLWDNQLTDEAAVAIACSDDLRELEALDLGWNRIGPAGARALACSPVLSKLERLNLYHNEIGDDGARALAASRRFTLCDLNLCRNDLSSRAASALLDSGWARSLRRLHAGCNRLGDDGVAMLAKCEHVEELNVRMNGIGPRGAEALARAQPRLRILGIEDNPIGDRGASALADGGVLGSAELAIMIDIDITRDGLERIAAHPRRVPGGLRLGLNAVGDEGVDALLDGPGAEALTELGLPCTGIGTRGARRLASFPFGPQLAILDLVGNDIGDAERAALCSALPEGALRIDGPTGGAP